MGTHYRGAPKEVRALDTLIKLNRATESLMTKLGQSLSEHGITLGQLAVMEALLHLGAMSQGELARKLLRSNPNMTTVIDNLEKNGWVRRERSAEDRRVVQVSLTGPGRELIAKVFPSHARRVVELMEALSEQEQERLGELCKKLGRSMAD